MRFPLRAKVLSKKLHPLPEGDSLLIVLAIHYRSSPEGEVNSPPYARGEIEIVTSARGPTAQALYVGRELDLDVEADWAPDLRDALDAKEEC